VPNRDPGLERAYAACLKVARQHYENFPVASQLLPRGMRAHIAAVYAFARYADDFADEDERNPIERLALLEDWKRRLRVSIAGELQIDTNDQRDLIFRAVADTVRSCNLPIELFEDLLSAFKQDVTTHRYETWVQLLDYCRRSANPVGRIVLRIAGYRNRGLDEASDNLCSALQLTNFIQDFAIDWQRGRLYIPAEMIRLAGARESDLDNSYLSTGWRDAVKEVALRTRELFKNGRFVCDGVNGRLKYELRFTWLGGVRILDQLQLNGYDPCVHKLKIELSDSLHILWQAAQWRRRP